MGEIYFCDLFDCEIRRVGTHLDVQTGMLIMRAISRSDYDEYFKLAFSLDEAKEYESPIYDEDGNVIWSPDNAEN